MRALVLGLILVAACSAEKVEQRPEQTRRERDSVIAASRLPGAHGVAGAMRAADSITSRTAALDSIAR